MMRMRQSTVRVSTVMTTMQTAARMKQVRRKLRRCLVVRRMNQHR
jgi:hypothetical protein